MKRDHGRGRTHGPAAGKVTASLARVLTAGLVLVLVSVAVRPASAQAVPYRDVTLPVADRVRDLLGRMTLQEKFWQLYMSPGSLDDAGHDYSNGSFGLQIGVAPRGRGDVPGPASDPVAAAAQAAGVARAHAERINAIQRWFVEETRLGIPILPFDEALHGLTRAGATVFPQAIAIAATWDTSLAGRVATAIAREVRSRGIRDVLSPVVNIASDVRWGRVEETYGEDPFLASAMAVAFVSPFERAGVVTTPKHFVANVGEGGRDSYPIQLGDRLLEEIHYPPFRTAIGQGGARSVMTAYNSVDGSPATQSRELLNGTLKGDWGFTGFVISDAAATGGATVLHMTEPNTPTAAKHAFEAGLDVVFQSSWPQHRPYLAAFERGMIADSIIDAAVARVLRAKLELGVFEEPYADPDSAAYWNGHAEHRALAREAARASIVLLRNERSALPLDALAIHSVAVIGADATEPRLGGYSGPGIHRVSILDGIREMLGTGADVRYAPGPGRTTREYTVIPSAHLQTEAAGARVNGLRGQYFDNNRLEGEPRIDRIDERIDFRWTLNSPGRGIPFDWYSVRWTGMLTSPLTGVSRIGVEGNDGYRLWLDGELIIDNWRKQSYGAHLADVTLEPGREYEVRLEYFESTGNARVRLVWGADSGAASSPAQSAAPGSGRTAAQTTRDWRAQIDSAVAIARGSDVAIVVAGIEEGEFRDRASLALPGHQPELIRAVAAAGSPVVVVTIGGSAITMSDWIDGVDAVVHAWYPGDEGGHAVADVLFGETNPAGRLPVTFPMAEGQLPLVYNHKPTGRGDDYLDLTGQPLFPFGFGLSYSAFEYSALSIEPVEIDAGGTAVVRATVTNTSARAGDEVVQLYLRDELASVARPVMELKGFRRIRLEPGEQRIVEFVLGETELSMLDTEMHRVVEPGAFRIMVGGSSKDIRLRGHLNVR